MPNSKDLMAMAAKAGHRLSGLIDPRGKPIGKQPTIMIGLMLHDSVPSDFTVAFGTLCAAPGFPIALSARVPDMNYPVSVLLNDMVHTAMEAKVDYILFLNSDVLIPQSGLRELMAWDREIVGVVYRNKVPPYNLICSTVDGQPQKATEGVVEIGTIPLGCTLVRMGVFQRLSYPWFYEKAEEGGTITPAFVRFCNNAREAGIKVWADITLSGRVGRLGKNIFMTGAEYGEPNLAGPAAEKAA